MPQWYESSSAIAQTCTILNIRYDFFFLKIPEDVRSLVFHRLLRARMSALEKRVITEHNKHRKKMCSKRIVVRVCYKGVFDMGKTVCPSPSAAGRRV